MPPNMTPERIVEELEQMGWTIDPFEEEFDGETWLEYLVTSPDGSIESCISPHDKTGFKEVEPYLKAHRNDKALKLHQPHMDRELGRDVCWNCAEGFGDMIGFPDWPCDTYKVLTGQVS
jgi:hypothetical protein